MTPLTTREWWKEILQKTLPGEAAQLLMAPTFRGYIPEHDQPVRAAVLILLYPSRGETHLVFMKRNEYKGPHSGQVSFPGGAWEAADGSLEQTAIRECREEIGIQDGIEVLGALTPLHIPVSNFLVSPFVGWMENTPKFHPDPTEVQYVIEVSLRELLDPDIRESEILYHHMQAVEAPFFRVGSDKIWGATAMMLSEFLEVASWMQ